MSTSPLPRSALMKRARPIVPAAPGMFSTDEVWTMPASCSAAASRARSDPSRRPEPQGRSVEAGRRTATAVELLPVRRRAARARRRSRESNASAGVYRRAALRRTPSGAKITRSTHGCTRRRRFVPHVRWSDDRVLAPPGARSRRAASCARAFARARSPHLGRRGWDTGTRSRNSDLRLPRPRPIRSTGRQFHDGQICPRFRCPVALETSRRRGR